MLKSALHNSCLWCNKHVWVLWSHDYFDHVTICCGAHWYMIKRIVIGVCDQMNHLCSVFTVTLWSNESFAFAVVMWFSVIQCCSVFTVTLVIWIICARSGQSCFARCSRCFWRSLWRVAARCRFRRTRRWLGWLGSWSISVTGLRWRRSPLMTRWKDSRSPTSSPSATGSRATEPEPRTCTWLTWRSRCRTCRYTHLTHRELLWSLWSWSADKVQ